MVDSKVTRSIRADAETIDRFKELSNQFVNQGECLETLIRAYEMDNAKSIEELKSIVNGSEIFDSQKEVLLKIIDSHSLSSESREAWALNLIEEEEVAMAKNLEKIDIVTRIGPTLGLMGTLIPMGPGLAALGSGDVSTLASAIIVAFDTTVVGIGSGAVAYVIAKVRHRWYEEYSSNLQLFVNAVLENLNK